jgi:hypothetical protein
MALARDCRYEYSAADLASACRGTTYRTDADRTAAPAAANNHRAPGGSTSCASADVLDNKSSANTSCQHRRCPVARRAFAADRFDCTERAANPITGPIAPAALRRQQRRLPAPQ